MMTQGRQLEYLAAPGSGDGGGSVQGVVVLLVLVLQAIVLNNVVL